MGRTDERRRISRRPLVRIGLVICVLAFALQLGYIVHRGWPPDDFVAYWSASHLNLTGGNPYSSEDLLGAQREVFPSEKLEMPRSLWNPPWTLTLLMPLALLQYPVARSLMLLIQLSLLFFSAIWIWQYYDGARRKRWLALVVAASFVPSVLVLKGGQSGLLILLGLLGFLHFERRHRWWLAGGCTVLVAIKPQLLYLFWIALLLWVISKRRWSLALGALGATLLSTMIAWLANPNIISQYLAGPVTAPPMDWAPPTFGAFLRLLFGIERQWLQLVPAVAGALWFLYHWYRHNGDWQWEDQMPLLVAVSLATTLYGGEHDLVVLLLPLIQAAGWFVVGPQGRAKWFLGGSFLAMELGALIVLQLRLSTFWYFWLGPVFLVWYLLARRMLFPVLVRGFASFDVSEISDAGG